MKRLLLLFFLVITHLQINARITVICDVVYEKSIEEWSDYYRTNVDFLCGKEMNDIMNYSTLFAIIWYSQTQCSVIKIEKDFIILDPINYSSICNILSLDLLNEGLLGIQMNDDGKQTKWRIYGKDENGFLIDPMFNKDIYNTAIREGISKGISYRRERPQEEKEYEGLTKGTIAYFSSDNWYIIKTRYNYIGVCNTSYYTNNIHNVGDVVFGDFQLRKETLLKNATKGNKYHNVKVQYISETYGDCYNKMTKLNEGR